MPRESTDDLYERHLEFSRGAGFSDPDTVAALRAHERSGGLTRSQANRVADQQYIGGGDRDWRSQGHRDEPTHTAASLRQVGRPAPDDYWSGGAQAAARDAPGPRPARRSTGLSSPDAMRWSPSEGEHEMSLWQEMFHDRRTEGRRNAPR